MLQKSFYVLPVCVCVREQAVCVFVCDKLHCMQVDSLQMIVLRHSLCLPYPCCWWVEVGNVTMMMYNLFVCVYKRAL